MWHVWRREMHTGFLWGNLRKRDNLEGLGIDGEDNIEVDLEKIGGHGLN
jgi:hypothetical protein